MEREKLAEELKKIYLSKFKSGWIFVNKAALGGDSMLMIKTGLVPYDQIPNKIEHNDPMRIIISIDFDKKVMEYVTGGLSVNPKQKYLAMSTVKTLFRKSKFKDEADIIRIYKRYVDKIRKIVDENKHDIYGVDRYTADI